MVPLSQEASQVPSSESFRYISMYQKQHVRAWSEVWVAFWCSSTATVLLLAAKSEDEDSEKFVGNKIVQKQPGKPIYCGYYQYIVQLYVYMNEMMCLCY